MKGFAPAQLVRLAVLALLASSAWVSQAIVIRHDVGSDEYEVRNIDFPAVFFLERQGSRKVCAATLIHPQWAITAAHCVQETMLGETMAAGRRFGVEIGNRDREIDLVISHPDYDLRSSTDVDLALLRFRAASPTPLPLGLYTGDAELGQVVNLLGWGYFGLGTTGRQYDDGRMRRAENRIEVSDRRLRMTFDDPRTPGADSLAREGSLGLGDSGGPALLQTATGLVLVGVAVGEVQAEDYSEETQGHYGAVTVFERISRHIDWIETVIGSPVPFDS